MPASATTQEQLRPPALDGGVDGAARAGRARASRPTIGVLPPAAAGAPGGSSASIGDPGVDRLVAAPGVDRAQRRSATTCAGGGVGGGPTTIWPGCAVGLQALRGVHDVAHGGVVAAGPQGADEHLAGVDADAHPQAGVDRGRVAVSERLLHAQRGTHRALGVVLVGDRARRTGRGSRRRRSCRPGRRRP